MTLRNLLLLLLIGACTPPVPPEPWLGEFVKPATNPVLRPDSSATFFCPVRQTAVQWQLADVFNPAAVVRNDSVFLLFRAEDDPGAIIGGRTSRIGLAVSVDGEHFTKYPDPVLYPDTSGGFLWDYPGGCEDPRIVEMPEGGYLMTYTSWDRKVARLSCATSPDLLHWEKHGPAFAAAHEGCLLDSWSKSGSVVAQLVGDRLVAARIDGRYWMYWGEQFVNLATSDNLIDWTPLLDDQDELLRVMETRPGFFDSFLTEPGPPALLTDRGILLLYNGKNAENEQADPALPRGTYSGGQALFDAQDPRKLLDRMDRPFIRPDLPHEQTGQYQAGTTFIEGLVRLKGRWLLYYGTADSMVGVAAAGS
ncbi:MAG: glycoside hydrolase family 130 protein [Bacteroidia bacterium]